ncbi:MAG: thioredoxin domain-containing protein [Proteobacteria bacterium]|nr:thioredoxin domain-containing protein [Pseudomonadota bacterium]
MENNYSDTIERAAAGAVDNDPNHLSGEKSPYLLQHASNPVEWHPWSQEAFEKAQREDKPIFLSIGYSTCHWCHVMERESFEDLEVAALMNENFVSIKVDREERPDIDHIYMTVCQIMTGSGGWPLTIIMTPIKEPFFAATYIPKESRFGQTGLVDLIPNVAEAWQSNRKKLVDSAKRAVFALEKATDTGRDVEPGAEALHLAFTQLASHFDQENAGFGHSMKFPTPHQLIFLLRYWHLSGNDIALEMAEKTLMAMRRGGIFDQVGFGFHRYSTDPRWLVPHFEKMLYDQALLLWAYVEAFEATQNELYEKSAREIIEYILRDMSSNEGAFYSAEDADSEGEEGKFYLWTEDEIRGLLDEQTAEVAIDAFNVSAQGNFAEEATGQQSGNNILHFGKSIEKVASLNKLSVQTVEKHLETARQTLLKARGKRVRPLLDDKVLTDWNGLMIGALSMAARVLKEPRYAGQAKKAADFILARLVDQDGRLLHRFRDGEAGLTANLDDYAFFVFGLIELYEATFETEYLHDAMRINKLMIRHFADIKGGGFFLSSNDVEKVLVRPKELYDGAIPSGNSIAFYNLLRLSRITGDTALEQTAAATSGAFGRATRTGASAHTMFLNALVFALGPSLEVVIAGKSGADDTEAMLEALRRVYVPNKVVLLRPQGDEPAISSLAPFVADQSMKDGKATAYVCVDRSCSFPTTDPKTMIGLINKQLVQKKNSGRKNT